ncbi:hypothetical protein FGG08_001817 [Glutinoglossum americanum]|uniref:Uncharacterized protein n=1 Tax=Glutinoglossum americanum TaxID=1670608 RepID=A0A9P8IAU8_9PEZI|nr:hypothetical protein FGG08_001817 [Glutinoglossum americanum]
MSEDPRVLLNRVSLEASTSSPLAKAEKAAQSAKGGWSFFGPGEEKWEKAVELFKQAAAAFRKADQGM